MIKSAVELLKVESVDGLLENLSLSCRKLVRTRSKHYSDYV